MSKKSVTAIILVAGNSTRFGKNRNKNFEVIEGKEVLLYSLEKFNENELVNDIIIVCKKNEENIVKGITNKIVLNKELKYITGGATRQESVYNALVQTEADIVIIHDGARPMVKDIYITKCIEEMENFKGVSIAVKSKDTIKITDDDGIVMQTTLRKNTWVIQTPQCFEKKTLIEMHKKFMGDETVTDDCMLMERSGNKVKLIEGGYSNIKVTTYDDVNLVKGYLSVEK